MPCGRNPARLVIAGLAFLGLAALLALLPSDAFVGLLLLGLAGLTLVRPLVGLLIAAFGVPFGALAPLPLGAGALTVTPMFLALAALGWLLAALQRRRLPNIALPRPVIAVLSFFALTQAWAAYWAPDWLAALFETARWAELAIAMVLAAGLASRPRAIKLLMAALLLAGSLQALLGLGMAIEGIGPPSFAVLGGRLFRAHGSFGQPNPFAGYMNMVWPLGAAILMVTLSEPRTRRFALGWPLFLVGLLAAGSCTLALVASWSRGGWLAAAAGGSLMGGAWLLTGLREASGRMRMLALAWLLGTVSLVALLAGALERVPASIVDRLASISDAPAVWNVADAEVNDATFSTIERVAHWEAAVSMFAERPWRGQGPGHYALAYPAHRLPRWSDALGHAHNTYLNFLAESGIPGLAGFLAWLAMSFALALRSAWPRPAPQSDHPRPCGQREPTLSSAALARALGLGLLGVVGSLTAHAFLDNLFVHEMTVHLGLLLGLCIAVDASRPRWPQRPGAGA